MNAPLRHLPEGVKNAGDVLASVGAATSLVSHWAAVLTPILTFFIALATLSWWALRFRDRFTGRGQ